MNQEVHLVECPRDAMQGWHRLIPAEEKVAYINLLMQAGFHTLDCLSFVSPRAIPQMADSHEVVRAIRKGDGSTRVLAIVANVRGAEDAMQYDDVIDVLGYPFSISLTFQMRNANSTLEESWLRLLEIHNLCLRRGKELCVYISMAFGNPYGDDYDTGQVLEWVGRMQAAGIRIVSLADTVGLATAAEVGQLSAAVLSAVPGLETGVHLHSTPQNWQAKLEAAMEAGIRRFDGAMKGFGGCPMAKDELVGNMNTEMMVEALQAKGYLRHLNTDILLQATARAGEIFR